MNEIKVSIFRREGQKVYQMQYRDPLTGAKIRRTTGKTTDRDAQREAGTWEKELREKGDKRFGRISWAEFREQYEEQALAGLADKTFKKAWGVLNVFERLINPANLRSVTGDVLGKYAKALRDEDRSENTIKSHLAHLRAALSWAVDVGYLPSVPKVPKVQRAKVGRVMKGRPITGEEFDRMLAKVEDQVTAKHADDWKQFLNGLWLSGLRLAEALELHWTDDTKLCVDLTLAHPMLRIPAELEKGNKDRLLPMAPEFAEFLMKIPLPKRHGYVFKLQAQREKSPRIAVGTVGRVISAIGEAAKVVVAEGKTASAHDLRRSFGERWASRVMPQILMHLMRHESIETTMRYYVGRNAQTTAAVLWEAHKNQQPQAKGRRRSAK